MGFSFQISIGGEIGFKGRFGNTDKLCKMKQDSTIVRAALLGYGYWGVNLLRNLFQHGSFDVVGVVDASEAGRNKAAKAYPHVPRFASVEELFKDKRPQVVLIATPPQTHCTLAIQCLEKGADVLIEKPMALSVAECDQIITVAKRLGRRVMVDHTFVYNPAVRYMAEEIPKGTFGRLLYYDSVRVNLGGFQPSTNVMWDLAPHDLSILDLLTGGKTPVSVMAMASDHYEKGNANLCYCHLKYADGFVAHLNLNWVAPTKIRTVMLGGTDKLCVYDENLPGERVKIFNKGVEVVSKATGPMDPRISYRVGDIHVPALSSKESLAFLLDSLHAYLSEDKIPPTDAEAGRRIVGILEALSQSLEQGGMPIAIGQSRTVPRRQKAA